MLLPLKIFLLFFVLIIPLASSLEFGARPSEVDIDIHDNEEYCDTIKLFLDKGSKEIIVHDKWSNSNSKDIIDYVVDSSDAGVDINYINNFQLNENYIFDFCIDFNEKKDYNGVLVFEIKDSNFAIGVWIKAKSERKGILSKVTGNYFNVNEIQNNLILQLGFSFILIVVLIFLILKLRK